jgi:hypothetical protein
MNDTTTSKLTRARGSITALMVAAALAAGGAARPAHAQNAAPDGARPAPRITASLCYKEWHAALITAALGKKCNYMDAAAGDKMAKAEAMRLQCFQSKATGAEQADLAKKMAEAKSTLDQRVAGMQCTPDMKAVYDRQYAKLTK